MIRILSIIFLLGGGNFSQGFCISSPSRESQVFCGPGYQDLQSRNIATLLRNSLSDEENEENDSKHDFVVDEKPKYRSKLQRLNQVQNYSKNVNRMKKKTKLKNRRMSSLPPTSESSGRSMDEAPRLFSDTGFPIDEDYAIDSFLRGEYDRPFSEDAAAPLPKHKPSEIVELALRALRDLDIPTTYHGAAVFMRFCAPLSRFDRWGGNISGAISPWKAIMRGSLTPTMLASRLKASDEFSVLLNWEQLDVTEGTKAMPNEMLGYESTIAFVNAALFFGDGKEPSMCQFTLKMFNGVWLIDSAVMNKRELFMEYES